MVVCRVRPEPRGMYPVATRLGPLRPGAKPPRKSRNYIGLKVFDFFEGREQGHIPRGSGLVLDAFGKK